jgi:protein transport protein DSL1/ZW10
VGFVRNSWRKLVSVSEAERTVRVETGDVVGLLGTMGKMGILSSAISRLHRDLDTVIITPRVKRAADGSVPRVKITKKEEICLGGRSSEDNEVEELIEDIYKIINFVQGLPEEISEQLLERILPSLILQLVSKWLDPSMPLELDHLEHFESITTKISDLAQFLKTTNVNLPSDADLETWLKRIPQNWLARRKEAALFHLRANCYTAVRTKQVAERVETQVVSSDDVMYGEHLGDSAENPIDLTREDEQQEDWDSGWNEDEPEDDKANGKVEEPRTEDDEDAGAWDMEESEPSKQEITTTNDDEDGADAWGWGDENEEIEHSSSFPAETKQHSLETVRKKGPTAPKSITLRETYTITHIPSTIITLISSVLDDATTLSSPSFPIHEISFAVPGLSTIPTLILAMYRATANTYYINEKASNMLIYNDTTNLSASIQAFLSEIPPNHPLANLSKRLDPDIISLSSFARRAYGREMAAQRTVLADILSSASGFVNCTLPLNSKQYKATVEDAVKHVRGLNDTWKGVLSDSARLQSLGGLVAELAKGITTDILERADDAQGISESQSKNLKGFIDQVITLQDLFYPPENLLSGEERSLVHVYTPGWLRFVYLGEILEASLADIRYLWTEGELKLEFEANEVIDLIQALFADSAHRRDAIRAIKRTSVNRGV